MPVFFCFGGEEVLKRSADPEQALESSPSIDQLPLKRISSQPECAAMRSTVKLLAQDLGTPAPPRLAAA